MATKQTKEVDRRAFVTILYQSTFDVQFKCAAVPYKTQPNVLYVHFATCKQLVFKLDSYICEISLHYLSVGGIAIRSDYFLGGPCVEGVAVEQRGGCGVC